MRRGPAGALIAAALILVAAVTGALITLHRAAQPPRGHGVATIVVSPGMSLTQVAKALEDAGVIRSKRYFAWMAGRKGLEGKIKAGEYRVKIGLSPKELLDIFVRGRVVYRRVTVPEGKTLVEISSIIESAGIGPAERFRLAASNTEAMKEWLSPFAQNLEGVLFPDTYLYTKDASPEDMVKMMTERFNKVVEPLWTNRGRKVGLNKYEAVILASIVERETGRADERPLIAGLFLNRLKRNMRLMSDPTVIYGIPDFDGNLTREHLRKSTPYNTYTIDGLPPGAICNPGAEAIKAVLRPASTDKLYFVAKGDGSHYFSSTLAEHNEAVRRYQMNKHDAHDGQ